MQAGTCKRVIRLIPTERPSGQVSDRIEAEEFSSRISQPWNFCTDERRPCCTRDLLTLNGAVSTTREREEFLLQEKSRPSCPYHLYLYDPLWVSGSFFYYPFQTVLLWMWGPVSLGTIILLELVKAPTRLWWWQTHTHTLLAIMSTAYPSLSATAMSTKGTLGWANSSNGRLTVALRLSNQI